MTLEEFKEYKNRPKCFYTKEEIQEILNDISQKVVVDTLPTEGQENYLYLVPSMVNPGTYEQYIWKNNDWEHLGNVDEAQYTDYVTNPELDNTIERISLVTSAALNDLNDRKQDKVESGNTANRPNNVDTGFIYWDTTLGKMIAWNGTAWVNLDGTALA